MTDEFKDAIARGKDLTRRLMDELDAITAHVGEIEGLIEIETASDKDFRWRTAMLKAVSLPARSAVLKTLLTAVRTWAELERGGKATVGKPADPAAPEKLQSNWGFLDDAPGPVKSVN